MQWHNKYLCLLLKDRPCTARTGRRTRTRCCTLWGRRSSSNPSPHTPNLPRYDNIAQLLLNQTKIRLYLPFWFDLIRFLRYHQTPRATRQTYHGMIISYNFLIGFKKCLYKVSHINLCIF